MTESNDFYYFIFIPYMYFDTIYYNSIEKFYFCCWFYNFFPLVPENVEEKLKRQKIEAALKDPNTHLSKWQEFAKTGYGLVSGKFNFILNFVVMNLLIIDENVLMENKSHFISSNR